MAEIQDGNWDEDFKNDKPNKSTNTNSSFTKTLFLTTNVSGDYKFRLVGKYIQCYKHFKPYKATLQESEKNGDPAWLAGHYPTQRFAINVIDRADGKLKILEKPWSVFKHFADYKRIFKKDPTKNEGCDWLLTVKVPDDGSFSTDYSVMRLEDTPFTAEEKALLWDAEKKEYKLWPLKTIYKSTTPEEMKKMWDALSPEQKIAPKKEKKGEKKASTPTTSSSKSSAPVEEKMSGSPADNGEDVFANTKEASEVKTSEVKTASAQADTESAELF